MAELLLLNLLFISVIGLSFVVWPQLLARLLRVGLAETPPFEPRQPAPWNVLDVLAIAVAYILVQAGVINAALTLFERHRADEFTVSDQALALGGNAVGNLIIVAAAAVYLRLRTGASATDLGWSPRYLSRDLRTGWFWFGVVVVPTYALQLALTQLVPSRHPVVEVLQELRGPATMALSFIVAVIVAPIAEEFLFRGVLQGALEALYTPAERSEGAPIVEVTGLNAATIAELPTLAEEPVQLPTIDNPYAPPALYTAPAPSHPVPADARPSAFLPIFSSSLIFAALHYGHGPDPIPLFFLSLVLGWLYRQTHRLMPGVVLHATLNFVSLSMVWLSPAP
jgi:membrane protease YdiL (CAAX protease family)